MGTEWVSSICVLLRIYYCPPPCIWVQYGRMGIWYKSTIKNIVLYSLCIWVQYGRMGIWYKSTIKNIVLSPHACIRVQYGRMGIWYKSNIKNIVYLHLYIYSVWDMGTVW